MEGLIVGSRSRQEPEPSPNKGLESKGRDMLDLISREVRFRDRHGNEYIGR